MFSVDYGSDDSESIFGSDKSCGEAEEPSNAVKALADAYEA